LEQQRLAGGGDFGFENHGDSSGRGNC